MSEEWRPIAGFDGYEVSNDGRVRNGARVLKPWLTSGTGYPAVRLPDRRKHAVHRLVAMAFCDGYADGMVVDHINCDRADNRATNLRWVTYSENNARSYREFGQRGPQLGRKGAACNRALAIVATNLSTGEVRTFGSAIEAVQQMGFSGGGISNCCHGKRPSHLGWAFRFADGLAGYPHKREGSA